MNPQTKNFSNDLTGEICNIKHKNRDAFRARRGT